MVRKRLKKGDRNSTRHCLHKANSSQKKIHQNINIVNFGIIWVKQWYIFGLVWNHGKNVSNNPKRSDKSRPSQATEHENEGSTLALKPRADVTVQNRGISGPTKRTRVLQIFFKIKDLHCDKSV